MPRPTPEQPTLGTRSAPVIEVGGLKFKDLDGDGQLSPYEDWRLPAGERAADLVSRMTLEEKAGLMLIDTVNAAWGGTLTDIAHDYVGRQHMRRIIFRNVVAVPGEERQGDDSHPFVAGSSLTPRQAAVFLNAVQELAEGSRLGIPVLAKSNARNHIDPDARAGINESNGAFSGFPKEAGLAAAALGARPAGAFAIALGGDHSVSMGTVPGAAAGRELGVLWVDAHADMNTPESSPSGNVHGMPLACLLGKGPGELSGIGGFFPKVDPARCAVIGLRNLDEREKGIVRDSGVAAYTMNTIDRRGLAAVMDEALGRICEGDAAVHVSFDMDGVDPSVSPGVGTPVRGGFSYREAHLIMEMVADTRRLIALDMVELNPILDDRNSTAVLGCELILSALGKRIL